MNNVMSMQIMHSSKSLHKILESLAFREDSFGVLMIEKIAFFCIFHNHIDYITIDNCIPKFDDMWMIKLKMYSDLSLD